MAVSREPLIGMISSSPLRQNFFRWKIRSAKRRLTDEMRISAMPTSFISFFIQFDSAGRPELC